MGGAYRRGGGGTYKILAVGGVQNAPPPLSSPKIALWPKLGGGGGIDFSLEFGASKIASTEARFARSWFCDFFKISGPKGLKEDPVVHKEISLHKDWRTVGKPNAQ